MVCRTPSTAASGQLSRTSKMVRSACGSVGQCADNCRDCLPAIAHGLLVAVRERRGEVAVPLGGKSGEEDVPLGPLFDGAPERVERFARHGNETQRADRPFDELDLDGSALTSSAQQCGPE